MYGYDLRIGRRFITICFQVSRVISMGSIRACDARRAIVKIMFVEKVLSTKRTRRYRVRNAVMKRHKRKILACRVSEMLMVFFTSIDGFFICSAQSQIWTSRTVGV